MGIFQIWRYHDCNVGGSILKSPYLRLVPSSRASGFGTWSLGARGWGIGLLGFRFGERHVVFVVQDLGSLPALMNWELVGQLAPVDATGRHAVGAQFVANILKQTQQNHQNPT